jgi:hypothetical protein
MVSSLPEEEGRNQDHVTQRGGYPGSTDENAVLLEWLGSGLLARCGLRRSAVLGLCLLSRHADDHGPLVRVLAHEVGVRPCMQHSRPGHELGPM